MVDNYIEDLDKSNPKLSKRINELWLDAQLNTQNYQGQSIANKLDELIELTSKELIDNTAKDWCIGEDELQFLVDNYRVGKDKQIAETTAKLESMLTQLVGTNPDAQNELADFLAKW